MNHLIERGNARENFLPSSSPLRWRDDERIKIWRMSFLDVVLNQLLPAFAQLRSTNEEEIATNNSSYIK